MGIATAEQSAEGLSVAGKAWWWVRMRGFDDDDGGGRERCKSYASAGVEEIQFDTRMRSFRTAGAWQKACSHLILSITSYHPNLISILSLPTLLDLISG